MGLYDGIIGTLLVGIFFNTFLYGLVTYQFAVYYRTKFDDPPWTKYMVLFLFLLDTFHSASVIYMAWYYTVTNYDNPAALAMGQWPYPFTAIGISITAVVTQMYLGHRIWRLTNSNILYGVVVLLAIPSCVLGIVCGIGAWIIWVQSELSRLTPIVIPWLTMQVLVDVFISVTLIIIFSRRRTGFRRTDTVLNRFIRNAVKTGLFTAIFSIGDLICFVVFPTTNLYGMFGIPLGRIYTNTFMHNLLCRESLKAELRAGEVTAAFTSIMFPVADASQASSHMPSTGNQRQIQVQRTVEEAYDASTSSYDTVKGKVAPPPV